MKDELYRTVGDDDDSETVVSLVSDPRNLHLHIESVQPIVTLRLASLGGDEALQKNSATINISPEAVTATNHKGEKLKLASSSKSEKRWSVEIRIPYSVVQGQPSWINGVDHGRYVLQIGDAKPQSAYMLSSHERFVSRLESLVAGTISLWHDYWTTHRNIPSGYYRSGKPFRWNYGDAGNYAHLIKCVAFWSMYRDGTSEWELLEQQTPTRPIAAKPLPDSVLKVQGLK